MKTVAVLLAPGFEEGEAIVAIDVLRRLNIHVQTIACTQTREVVSYHAIPMIADSTLAESTDQTFDAVILPAGQKGASLWPKTSRLSPLVRRHDELGKYLCPICSAAARVLGGNGLLKGRRYVCSGELWRQVTDGVYVDADVVEDGNLISGRGLGKVFDFSLTVAARLRR